MTQNEFDHLTQHKNIGPKLRTALIRILVAKEHRREVGHDMHIRLPILNHFITEILEDYKELKNA